MIDIRQGDALEVLRTLPSDHFHCVVTSPPYFGLRDYGTGSWEGGDLACDHVPRQAKERPELTGGGCAVWAERDVSATFRDICGKCGARRIDQQIGLEATPDEWCARLVEVFREVRRVLRPDGVCWINIGDSYNNFRTQMGPGQEVHGRGDLRGKPAPLDRKRGVGTLKAKDLVGQPWMLAFALRADGWWLRAECIWAKPNPMPESVRDRPTKAHEQVFLLTKSPRYFYDAEAVREAHQEPWRSNGAIEGINSRIPSDAMARACIQAGGKPREYNPAGRNLRSVWTIATDPLPSVIVDGEKLDHFASYPVELARRCILAGTSAKGCCPGCGAPWARNVDVSYTNAGNGNNNMARKGGDLNAAIAAGSSRPYEVRKLKHTETTGWRPTCSCVKEWIGGTEFARYEPIPCRVLDPFFGSGRTGLACDELGRDCIGIELNPASVRMAHAQIERAKARRMIGDGPSVLVAPGQMDMFR
jgi:DNA modification methylase